MKKGKLNEQAEERMMSEPGLIGKLEMLRREALRPDEGQPRKFFDEQKLRELAASISNQGIVQPLVVEYVPEQYTLHEPDLTSNRQWFVLDVTGKKVYECGNQNGCVLWAGGEAAFKPYYRIAAGERRWRAAGLCDPPLDLVPCVVRGPMEKLDRFKLQHAENHDREGLTPLEEGESFHRAVYEEKLFTVVELAQQLGRKASHVYARLALAKAPKAVKDAVAEGRLNAALAELVAAIPGDKNQLKCLKEIEEGGGYEYGLTGDYEDSYGSGQLKKKPMSVRQAKVHIRKGYMLDLKEAAFDTKSKDLLPEAGSCADCPKRSGNCMESFPDLKNDRLCLDQGCHGKKTAAHFGNVRKEAEEQGLTVLSARDSKGLFSRWQPDELANDGQAVTDLKEKIPGDKKGRSYKDLLGKDAPAKVAAVSPTGVVKQFYQKEMLDVALAQKGFSFKDPNAREPEKKKTAEEIAREERQQKVREYLANELRQEVGTAVARSENTEKELAKFLRLLVFCLGNENGWSLVAVLKRQGVKWTQGQTAKLSEVLEDVKLPTLKVILMNILADLEDGNPGLGYDDEFSDNFKAMCAYAGIDLAAREKEALAASEATHAPGKKFEEEIARNQAKAKKKKK